MRLFIHEYTCGSGRFGPADGGSLHTEGWAMLAAVLADFARVPGVSVITLLDQPPEGQPAWRWRPVGSGEEETAFRAEVRSADFTLVIAPEFDRILETRCRWVEEEGGRLLGPTPSAIRLTADKLALAEHLAAAAVPTPRSMALLSGYSGAGSSESFGNPQFPVRYPIILKPRFGAGSQATFRVDDGRQAAAALCQLRDEGEPQDMIVQPFVPGHAVSVAFLIGPAGCLPLLPARQCLSADGRFRYLGGELPLPRDVAERAVRLAQQAVSAVDGLRGYVGVDLVLAHEGAAGDQVIEINPRLTTSYVGLRALAKDNLAAAMLGSVLGQELPVLQWQAGGIRFQADGAVSRWSPPRHD